MRLVLIGLLLILIGEAFERGADRQMVGSTYYTRWTYYHTPVIAKYAGNNYCRIWLHDAEGRATKFLGKVSCPELKLFEPKKKK